MSETGTCPKTVYRGTDWDPRAEPCGKPVKRDGLCGVHARQADIEQQRRNLRDLRATERERSVKLAGALSAAFGIKFGVFQSVITLTPEQATLLLDRRRP